MSVEGDFLVFDSGELIKFDKTDKTALSVADSWLVENGRARSLEQHFQRFRNWVNQTEQLPDETLTQFFEAVREAIPATGEWFPRIEFRQQSSLGQRLFLRIREAPPRTELLTLWTYPEADPREKPLVKGPDLSLCQQLRRKANLHGADEAVLLDKDGFIADGSLSSILWWRDETLCGPDESTDWLESITRQELFELADQAGFETVSERCKPSDLEGLEVWSASSLQGVRGVSKWSGVNVGPTEKLGSFRKRLQLLGSAVV
mgnify:CR=1 FL=1